MNCPECKLTNNKSEPAGWVVTKTTIKPVDEYYDTYRGYHNHDPNVYVQLHKCEKGHRFKNEFRLYCKCQTCPFVEYKKVN